MLDTVYVQAFTDTEKAVKAYTITATSDKMPQGISIINSKIDLGKSHFADVDMTVSSIAESNGAKMAAYYEISSPNNLSGERTMAVGATLAGRFPESQGILQVPPADDLNDLAPIIFDHNEHYYAIDEYVATPGFLKNQKSFRNTVVINSVSITAPGVPMVPQFISLYR